MAHTDNKAPSTDMTEEPAIIKVDEHDRQSIIGEDGETMFVIDPKEERKLVWKFDLRILVRPSLC